MFLKSRIQTSQDTLKQHFYCFKFLLRFQVVEIFFVLKILTFVVVLFFSSFLIQPLLAFFVFTSFLWRESCCCISSRFSCNLLKCFCIVNTYSRELFYIISCSLNRCLEC